MYVSLFDEIFVDFKERLFKINFFENFEGVEWEYGIDLGYMKVVVEYWKIDFDWCKQEVFINIYFYYKIKISGIEVYFVYYKVEFREGQ